MSRSPARDAELPPPRETTVLFGHTGAERTMLTAYRSGRMPHAWLIGGPPGIGKATLAYRMARFVLTYPDPSAPPAQAAHTLAIDDTHPVARRVAAQAHPDVLTLERTAGPSGSLRSVITVDDVRRTVGFFGSTAGAGGWRICIVDSADELQNPQGANALLKVLEEPPARALFFLVSHAPGRLLPTIRSRCRRLTLRPLDPPDIAQAAARALGRDGSDAAVQRAAAVAQGSVARAAMLLGGAGLAVRDRLIELLGGLPQIDPQALHDLGDTLGRADEAAFDTFVETIQDWLSAQLHVRGHQPHRLAPVAEVWEKLDRAARDVEIFNLDRKPLVFVVFGLLAETARR
jgi:DNA polymerase III subunit delta'